MFIAVLNSASRDKDVQGSDAQLQAFFKKKGGGEWLSLGLVPVALGPIV